MKNRHYILLGIKDYIKDVLHDYHFYQLEKFYKNSIYSTKLYSGTAQSTTNRISYFPIVSWKEDSLLHYIQQRKFVYKSEKRRGKKCS